MFDPKNIYALNKGDKDAIVYTDANHRVIRLTREDFDTERDFLTWKAWSDQNFHEEENQNHIHANNTVSMSDLPGDAAVSPALEVVIERRIEKKAAEQYSAETVIHIRGRLTQKQFRRLWMYGVEGMTEQEIAAAEGKTQQGISKSLKEAKNKILKILLSKDAK